MGNHPEIHGYLPITRAIFKGNKDIIRLYKNHGVACPSAKILGGEEWYSNVTQSANSLEGAQCAQYYNGIFSERQDFGAW